MTFPDPKTDAEWQEAADAAYFMLVLESARQFGPVEYEGKVNYERAEWILEEAKKRGIEPKKDFTL